MRWKLIIVLAWSLSMSLVMTQPQRSVALARSFWQADTPTPTVQVVPIQVSTPRPDGSIIHIVQSGQFLATIAQVYQIPLQDLLSMNGLTDQSVIFPGDKLFIRLPSTATLATEASVSGTPGPGSKAGSPTPKPSSTPPKITPTATIITPAPVSTSPRPQTQIPPQLLETTIPDASNAADGGLDFLLVAVLVLGVIGTALVALGSALKRSA